MYGVGFFITIFFETLHFFLKPSVFLRNYSTAFQKKVVSVGSGRGKSGTISLVFLHSLLASFHRTPLSTAFEKLCGGLFDPNCWIFFSNFCKELPIPNLRFGFNG